MHLESTRKQHIFLWHKKSEKNRPWCKLSFEKMHIWRPKQLEYMLIEIFIANNFEGKGFLFELVISYKIWSLSMTKVYCLGYADKCDCMNVIGPVQISSNVTVTSITMLH